MSEEEEDAEELPDTYVNQTGPDEGIVVQPLLDGLHETFMVDDDHVYDDHVVDDEDGEHLYTGEQGEAEATVEDAGVEEAEGEEGYGNDGGDNGGDGGDDGD